MFKTNLGKLYSQEVMPALHNLANQKLPFDVSWNLSRMIRQMLNELKTTKEEYLGIVDRYFQKDEQGKYIPSEIPGQFKLKEKIDLVDDKEKIHAMYQTSLDMFFAREVEIQSYKINSKKMSDCKIDANTLMAIEDFIE